MHHNTSNKKRASSIDLPHPTSANRSSERKRRTTRSRSLLWCTACTILITSVTVAKVGIIPAAAQETCTSGTCKGGSSGQLTDGFNKPNNNTCSSGTCGGGGGGGGPVQGALSGLLGGGGGQMLGQLAQMLPMLLMMLMMMGQNEEEETPTPAPLPPEPTSMPTPTFAPTFTPTATPTPTGQGDIATF